LADSTPPPIEGRQRQLYSSAQSTIRHPHSFLHLFSNLYHLLDFLFPLLRFVFLFFLFLSARNAS
jgi:hypothetical protein